VDTPRPSPRTNRTRRVPHPVLNWTRRCASRELRPAAAELGAPRVVSCGADSGARGGVGGAADDAARVAPLDPGGREEPAARGGVGPRAGCGRGRRALLGGVGGARPAEQPRAVDVRDVLVSHRWCELQSAIKSCPEMKVRMRGPTISFCIAKTTLVTDKY